MSSSRPCRRPGGACCATSPRSSNLQVSSEGSRRSRLPGRFRAEESLRQDLGRARPGFAFLMEESGTPWSGWWVMGWVVDPLDGTGNFLHGIPHWAISVGNRERRSMRSARSWWPGSSTTPPPTRCSGREKAPAPSLNDRRLRVSARRDMREALFATGIPFAAAAPRRGRVQPTLAKLMPQVAGIRRFGAAALDLAWLAAGRYDGYWELNLKKWDMATSLHHGARSRRLRDQPPGRRPLCTRAMSSPPATRRCTSKLREVVAGGHRRRRRGPQYFFFFFFFFFF